MVSKGHHSPDFLEGFLSKVFGRVSVSPEITPDAVSAAELDHVRARVHDVLQPDREMESSRSFEELFADFVATNRASGIDPHLPEQDGPVVYSHSDLVPMQGDLYWSQGRTVSSAEIDRRFKNLTL